MIPFATEQRSSFSKGSEVIDGFAAIDMDRLSYRLSKNIVGSVNGLPNLSEIQRAGVIDIVQEAENLLQAIESDSVCAKRSSLKPKPNGKSRKSFVPAVVNENDVTGKNESSHPAAQHAGKISVLFDQVIVREYPRILGATVHPSGGPSITMDWKHIEHPPLTVDDFESIRTKRRHGKDLLMSPIRREKLAERLLAESNAKSADPATLSPKQTKSVLSFTSRLKSILSQQRQ
ncbi:hypothetical protein FisN_14Lh072 [Fistulifera solaris]|uniref:Uncharacterized protein n=1 Tax=Fistulifera solaris TaxID=1519565 RepID=A0A1Z5J993_FISSO|nr:hypothetical protein FisN_14Lh072 [Fistulifera solaris]|eukprot:GAX10573.1 hypothetical protein FisN_14Lh072 [Fistulifera solaris]